MTPGRQGNLRLRLELEREGIPGYGPPTCVLISDPGKGKMRLNVQLGLVMTALLFSGCSNMPPIGALFDTSPEAIGTGITGVGVVRAFVIVAKYQATERQRQVAEQNARRAYQKIVALQETVPSVIFVDTSREQRSKGSKSVMIARFPKKRPSPSPSTRVEPRLKL